MTRQSTSSGPFGVGSYRHAIAACAWLGCAAVLVMAWLGQGIALPRWHAKIASPFVQETLPIEAVAAMHQRSKQGSRPLCAERTYLVSGRELPELRRRLACLTTDPTIQTTITVREHESVATLAPADDIQPDRQYEVHVEIVMRCEDLGPWNNLGPHAFTFNGN